MSEKDSFRVTEVAFAYFKKITLTQSRQIRNRPCYGLTIVRSGSIALTIGTDEYIAENGDIFLQRKNDSYCIKSITNTSEYTVISYDVDNEEILNNLLPKSRLFETEHSQKYFDLFDKAVSIHNSQGPCTDSYISALVQEIICLIVREIYPKSLLLSNNPAAAAKYFIDEYSNKCIDSLDIASSAGCSPTHLRRLFKTAYGITPIRYLNLVRINRAKEMLATGLFTHEEIASACGFATVTYFNNVFKSFTGVSPGKY